MPAKLRVLVVAPRHDAHESALARAVAEAGHEVVARLAGLAEIGVREPHGSHDVVVAGGPAPSPEHFAGLDELAARRPVVQFFDESDTASIHAAMRAGVAAFVVQPPTAERIASVLPVAVARFEENRRLRQELDGVKAKLSDRKVIDRAKGILMRRRELSEQDAYAALRNMAMSRNLRLVEVARSVLEIEEFI